MPADCPLCTREPRQPQQRHDDTCWTTLCSEHLVPMVVLNRHAAQPTERELDRMFLMGHQVFKYTFRGWREGQSLPEHFHLHAT